MIFLSQLWVACRVASLGMRQRVGSSLVIILGMTCVVGVSLSMLSLAAGLSRAIVAGGDSDHAIVFPADAQNEDSTALTRTAMAIMLNAPGIAVGTDAKPQASAEVLQWLPPAPGFLEGTLYLRAISPKGAAVRPGFAIVSGRMFRTGAQELIVGEGAATEFGMRVGSSLIMPNGEWPIVGEFTSRGSAVETQLLADADTVMSAFAIPGYGEMVVALQNPDSFDELKRWLTTNPALSVRVERQSDYLARVANNFTRFLATLAYFVGGLMAIGALFGSAQIMYSAVESRTIEIATLRAVGYHPLPIAMSVLWEAVFLSVIGGLLGSAIAWLLFNDQRTFNIDTVFRMRISAQMVLFGLIWAVVLAVLGGLMPAMRAARLPVAEALRAT